MDEAVKKVGAADLHVYVVWVPILPDDDAPAAARAAQRFTDPRVTHYWDQGRALGDALGDDLALPPREAGRAHGAAWDVYMVFGRGARWGERPAFWMHQLDDVPLTTAPRLRGASLRARIEMEEARAR
jgi:hypothetical protein